WLPSELGDFTDRLRRSLAGTDIVENIGARLGQIDELGIDGRIGEVVSLLHDHLGGAACIRQHLLERSQETAAEVVVLKENSNLGIRLYADDMLGENSCLGRIERQPGHR